MGLTRRETAARGGRKTKKIARIVVCLLAVPCAAVAQDGRIAGTVTDATGGVLPGVTITAAAPALAGGPRVSVTPARRWRCRSPPRSRPAGIGQATPAAAW